MRMRLFVALNIPDAERARIAAEVLAPLRERLPAVRWVRPETLHVTLAFLGERSDAELREAHTVVREVAATRAPLRVRLSGLGVFPDAERPRVLWLGVADPARERARLGVPAEGRAYHPHVTLGRVQHPNDAALLAGLAPALADIRFEATVTLPSLDLMRSETVPAGVRYTTLLAAPLSRPEGR